MQFLLKKVQLSGALIVLVCTIIGFGLEIFEMYKNKVITLPDLLLLFILGALFFWFYKKIKKRGLLLIPKGLLQIGIIILFIGGFFKLFITLQK